MCMHVHVRIAELPATIHVHVYLPSQVVTILVLSAVFCAGIVVGHFTASSESQNLVQLLSRVPDVLCTHTCTFVGMY